MLPTRRGQGQLPRPPDRSQMVGAGVTWRSGLMGLREHTGIPQTSRWKAGSHRQSWERGREDREQQAWRRTRLRWSFWEAAEIINPCAEQTQGRGGSSERSRRGGWTAEGGRSGGGGAGCAVSFPACPKPGGCRVRGCPFVRRGTQTTLPIPLLAQNLQKRGLKGPQDT